MDITDGNTTYTLPLDSLDHNLMSRFSRTEDRMIPLWSNIGLGKETHDKYYQIKVYAQNNNPDVPENLDELLAMQPLYKCSICNVEVPKAHKKDHVASPKHKITLKLAEKVLERTKSLILDTENDNIANVIPGTYFCESCAVSVDENQREDHELSKKHFKSILHDRFLNDLLLVYTDKENLEKLDFEYLNYTETEELNSQNELYKQMNKQNETNKQNESNKQNEPNKHSETKKQSETNKQSQTNKQNETKIQPQVPNEDTEILSVKGYLDLLMKRFKQESILSLEVVNEKIVIQVIDGTKIVVNQDNFHAYFANSDCTMCRVCMVVVDRNDGDMDESLSKKEFHKYTDMHMMRVMTALEDKHCIRQINSVIRHCIICNENLFNIIHHKVSPEHTKALQQAVSHNIATASTQAAKKSVVGKTYCEPCKTYIDTHNFIGHTNGKFHKANQTEFDKEKAKISKTYCGTCKIYVQTNNYIDHRSSKEHVDNFNATTVLNWQMRVNNSRLECRVCNVKVPYDPNNIKEHLKGSNHKRNYEILLIDNNIMQINNKLYCGMCKLYIQSETELDHIENGHPESNVREEKTNYVCHVCNVYVPNNPSCRKEHEAGFNHQTNLKNNTSNEIHPHYEKTSSQDTLRCKICNIVIIQSFAYLHRSSVTHLATLKSLIELNNIKSNGKDIICNTCNIKIELNKEFEHLSLDSHKKLMNSPTTSTKINLNEYFCTVCSVKVPNNPNNIASHNKGAMHNSKLTSVINGK